MTHPCVVQGTVAACHLGWTASVSVFVFEGVNINRFQTVELPKLPDNSRAALILAGEQSDTVEIGLPPCGNDKTKNRSPFIKKVAVQPAV